MPEYTAINIYFYKHCWNKADAFNVILAFYKNLIGKKNKP